MMQLSHLTEERRSQEQMCSAVCTDLGNTREDKKKYEVERRYGGNKEINNKGKTGNTYLQNSLFWLLWTSAHLQY